MKLANLIRFRPGFHRSAAVGADPFDFARELRRRRRGRWQSDRGTGASAARDLGPGWKISPASTSRRARHSSWPASPASRQDHPHLDHDPHRQLAHAHPARLLGRRSRAGRRGAVRRLLLQRLGGVRPGELAGHRREPARRLQLLLADAVPRRRPADGREHLGGRRAGVLPGHLRARWRPLERRLLPRAVAPLEPTRRARAAHDPRRHRGCRPVRRHLPRAGA